MVPLWMLSTAIACGNTFVLKPSEKVPSASTLLAKLAREAGLPDGVLNVVQGDKAAVDRLLEHPDIKAISFVGSTPVARRIYETAALGKRVQALGGAKNHMLVLPDADIAMAADAAVSAGYGAVGERCMAISVVLAVGDVADPLIAAIRDRVARVKVGPGVGACQRDGAADHPRTPRSRGRAPRTVPRRKEPRSRSMGGATRQCVAMASSLALRSWTTSGPACAVTTRRFSVRC